MNSRTISNGYPNLQRELHQDFNYGVASLSFAPIAIAAARAGELDLAEKHEEQCAYLANVVMRLPAWYAAHHEVRGHIAAGRGETGEALASFTAAAARFREAGHPIDAARCDGWVSRSE